MIAALVLTSFLVTYYAAILLQVAAPTVGVTTGEAQTSLQILVAFAVSGVITWMKTSSLAIFKKISESTPRLSKFISAMTAAAVALGIVVTSTGSFNSDEGLTVTIAGLSLTGIANAASTFISQWIFQHVSYTAIWKRAEGPAPEPAVKV